MIKRVVLVSATWACLCAGTALAASAASPAPAAGTPADPASPATAHAWDAWASSLASRGVGVSGSMTGLWIGDVAGGMKRGGVYNTLGFARLDGDLEKLTHWWHGGHAFVSGAWIRGGSASSQFVGDALVVSNLDGFDSIRLYQAWLEQGVAGGRASLRAGVLSADEEFCGTDGGSMLTNSAFGWEAGIGGNVTNGGPIYYAPGLGARLAVEPVKGWTLRAGAYDGDSFDSADGDPVVDQHGTHFELSRAQGAFLIGELTHEWCAEDPGPRGDLKLGAWRHTANVPDNLRDDQGGSFTITGLDPDMHHGIEGVYGVFEQKLWTDVHDTAQGVGGWMRIAAAPADRSTFSWVSEGGMRWIGPIPGRNADAIGVGVVTAYVSPDMQQQVRDANALDSGNRTVPDFERVVEAAYQVSIGDHWTVTPDVQWVQHPGTTRDTPNAVVAGLRITRQ